MLQFKEHYPDCTSFQHSIIIKSGLGTIEHPDYLPINDLSGLSQFTSIEGDLIILESNTIISIDGLKDNLEIGGELSIKNNPNLTSLISDDSSFLISKVGSVEISNNPKLENNNGHFLITNVENDFVVSDNPKLHNFNGLPKVSTINGNLIIQENDNLQSFCGIKNLNNIGNNLIIENNPSLSSLEGLHILNFIENEIIIRNNEVLETCCLVKKFDSFNLDKPNLLISNNGSDCTTEMVADACVAYGESDCHIPISVTYEYNFDEKIIIIEALEGSQFSYIVACVSEGTFEGPTQISIPHEAMSELTVTDLSTGCELVALLNGSADQIELLSFEGEGTKEGNILKWSTASENENNHFKLMRSSDGIHFEEISRVNGAGNSSVQNNYFFNDKTAPAAAYYRLDDIDYDGRIGRSDIIYIKNDLLIVDNNSFNIHPVPANETINVSFENEVENLSMFLYDMTGKLLKTFNLEKGQKSFSFDISDLSAGIYILKSNSGFAKMLTVE